MNPHPNNNNDSKPGAGASQHSPGASGHPQDHRQTRDTHTHRYPASAPYPPQTLASGTRPSSPPPYNQGPDPRHHHASHARSSYYAPDPAPLNHPYQSSSVAGPSSGRAQGSTPSAAPIYERDHPSSSTHYRRRSSPTPYARPSGERAVSGTSPGAGHHYSSHPEYSRYEYDYEREYAQYPPSHHHRPPVTYAVHAPAPARDHAQGRNHGSTSLRPPSPPPASHGSSYSTSTGHYGPSTSPGSYGSPPGAIAPPHAQHRYHHQQYSTDSTGQSSYGAAGSTPSSAYAAWQDHGREYPMAQPGYFHSPQGSLHPERREYSRPGPQSPPLQGHPRHSPPPFDPRHPYAPRLSDPHSTAHSSFAHSVDPVRSWSATRSPDHLPRQPQESRRRSASVDETIDREKAYYNTAGQYSSTTRHRSRSPVRAFSPPQYQYQTHPYDRMQAGYLEPTYIPSRSPSPTRAPEPARERKTQTMSIAHLIDKSSGEGADNSRPPSPHQRTLDSHPQGASPPLRYREHSPLPQETPSQHRFEDPPRGPGQLADRARMLPVSHSDGGAGKQSHGASARIESLIHHDHDPSQGTEPYATSKIGSYRQIQSGEAIEGAAHSYHNGHADETMHNGLAHEDARSTTEPWPESRLPSAALLTKLNPTPQGSAPDHEGPEAAPASAAVKRRPKAGQEKKKGAVKDEKQPVDISKVALDGGKVKAKRGRKPKAKELALPPGEPSHQKLAPSAVTQGASSATPQGAAMKRRRLSDSMTEDQESEAKNTLITTENGASGGAIRSKPSHGLYSSEEDSDQEDYSQHKDLMTYMLEVHKRGQRVQKAYEKQSMQKRRKLHEKFLAKQTRRLHPQDPLANGMDSGDMDEADDHYNLGHSRDEKETTPLQTPVSKGKGRGRKKLQPGLDSEVTIKPEQYEEPAFKVTKAEKKKRERREAAEAAAMAQAHANSKARQNLSVDANDSQFLDSHDEDGESDGQERDQDQDSDGSGQGREEIEDIVLDEEALARLQEEEYEAKRRAIWDLIAHKQIREMAKIVATTLSTKLQNCKKVAQLCQREARRSAARSGKSSKEIHARARRANREMLFFWKRNEREERELRKKAEKEAIEKLRIEEEMREARRQARKLNFLITQTELYSHFIGKKIGTEAAEADDDATPVRMQPTNNPEEIAIAQDPNHTPLEGDLDFEKDSDETLEAQAKWGAQQALLAAQERTRTFDEEAKEHREDHAKMAVTQSDFDEMNFQNPSSMPTVTEIEQPRMLMCQLKGYQIKGLNWLANLYEQGINGILADEMGLGKTVQSISLMAHLAEAQNIWGPFLVIAPASTLHNWQQEFTKFTPDLKALPYWGNIKDRKTLRKFWNKKQIYNKDAPFHVLITSYQLVVADEKYFQRVKWQYMVLDEAQAIKSSSSARWKTLLGFNCRNRLLLTGTPIQNSMQELWALLHFIMPSLFDSHEEFSEWFSKDIESHAENKGTLNEHQLKRLHMILKPFMLRRIKKNVQNELGDKIELEISCELTARQRALYRGLKEKISISELLEKASSLNDNDSVDSLMNLVMQFRKVCNHPELFERADVVSPLAMCTFSQTPSIAREGEDLFVAYTTRSHISYSIPKRLFRDGGLLRIPSEGSKAGSDTKYLDNLLNIWTPDHLHGSMQEEQGAFSFLCFSDYSPSQASKIFRGNLMERFAQHLESYDLRSRCGYTLEEDEDTSTEEGETLVPRKSFARFLIREQSDPLSAHNQSLLAHTQDLCHVLRKSELGEYLPMMEPAYRPKAVAPPIEMICSDRSFLVNQHELLFDARMRQMLLGVSEFKTEARMDEDVVPMMDLWQVNHGQGLLGEPSLSSMGYSTIEVPQMKQLVMDSGKLAVLDKLLVELKMGGHRVLIYFQMTRMIDLIEEYLTYRQYKYLRLDGSSKISDRRDMVTDWQTRPEIFIFLLSTRAGGLGINLTAADTVIFYDSDWNPTVDQQAMDRAHRLGQTRQVTVYRLITKGTIEERILQRAKQKDEIQKVVISGGEFKQSVEFKPREIVSLLLDDDELATKLQEQQLKRKAEEEEAKNSRKGGSSNAGNNGTAKDGSARPSKRAKKQGKESSSTVSTPAGAPSSLGAIAGTTTGGSSVLAKTGRTLDEMWADMDANTGDFNPPEESGAGGGGATPKAKRGPGSRGGVLKEKTPKEPKAKKEKKEKEPRAKKTPKLGKKAQAAADAAEAATAAMALGLGDEMDVDVGDMES